MKMIKSTRYRFLIVLLIACFLLVCLVLRTSIKFDGLLQKLRNFHQVMKVTRPPRVVFTVTQNNRKGSSNTPQTYGNKYWRTKDNTATWNDNLKRVTTGTKTDNIKVYPSKTHDLNIYPKTDEKYSGYGEISSCKKNPNRFILAKLFEYWMKLAEKEKIEYFLTCGTLLGAYRNGDIIPHDTDMDILVNRNDFLKIKKHRTRKKFTGFENEISIYVNKDFYQPYAKRRRFKCSGKVCCYCSCCCMTKLSLYVANEQRKVKTFLAGFYVSDKVFKVFK